MIRLRLRGMEVLLHWSFLLLAGLSAGWPLLRMGLGAALCHELAHLGAMCLFGCRPRCLRFGLTGGCLQGSGFPSFRAEAASLAAGPFCSLLLAAAFFGGKTDAARLFSAVNLVLGLFNLLPVQGLDGGRLLLLFLQKNDPLGGRGLCVRLSFLALAVLWGWCFFLWRQNPHLPTLLLLPLVPAQAFFGWLKKG